MAKEFKLPELGENIESADVIGVLVKVGDKLEKDQSIIEIETDKATVEVPSTLEGTVSEVMVRVGDNVQVGQTLIKVDEAGKISDKTPDKKTVVDEKKNNLKMDPQVEEIEEKKSSSKKSSGKKEIVELKVPDLGENIDSADVIGVLVKPGDMLKIDQGTIEIETDKATVEVPSTIEGKVIDVMMKEGDKAKVDDVILIVEIRMETPVKKVWKESGLEVKTLRKTEVEKPESAESYKGKVSVLKPGEIDKQPPIRKGSAPAAPSVRRIAREIGIDINEVKGTGPGGRISMDDVKAHSKKLHLERKTGAGFGIKQESLPDFTVYGGVEKVEMTKIRKVTADHLSYAWATIPHVTQFDKADITQLEKARKEYNSKLEQGKSKLTVTAILLKIMASALKEFPQFNGSINMETKEIIYKKYFNVGIAVDTERGLIVPVIKDVDKKNINNLSKEMGELAQKARDKKISLKELQGGCITITNLGGIGGTSFTPVINSPEVAILGVSRGSYEPIYNGNGVFEPRLMLPLSLSYDHRIIDGADAVRFLRWVVEALEKPLKLLIDG
ncbi:MAG: 2-oxo acid dehydrogenase subunit E2 [Bacteroidetes bacterium]|nr:2-oxo acid dehydrogenase subunit E2 [Bacteroidota bacterium]MCH7770541.1 2-oxo acid dehydrogenase subunit E2 [Bacteroidota bacterium]